MTEQTRTRGHAGEKDLFDEAPRLYREQTEARGLDRPLFSDVRGLYSEEEACALAGELTACLGRIRELTEEERQFYDSFLYCALHRLEGGCFQDLVDLALEPDLAGELTEEELCLREMFDLHTSSRGFFRDLDIIYRFAAGSDISETIDLETEGQTWTLYGEEIEEAERRRTEAPGGELDEEPDWQLIEMTDLDCVPDFWPDGKPHGESEPGWEPDFWSQEEPDWEMEETAAGWWEEEIPDGETAACSQNFCRQYLLMRRLFFQLNAAPYLAGDLEEMVEAYLQAK